MVADDGVQRVAEAETDVTVEVTTQGVEEMVRGITEADVDVTVDVTDGLEEVDELREEVDGF